MTPSPSKPSADDSSRVSRRSALAGAAAAAVGAAFSGAPAFAADKKTPTITKGRIKQSLVHWCYEPTWPDVDQMCEVAKGLGCQSIELIDPKHWDTLKKHGLTCAIAGSHMFVNGMNNPKNWEYCIDKMRTSIDNSAAFGCPSVITFTGYSKDDSGTVIPPDVGIENCIKGFKQIVGHAEKKKITLCLEMLNTRDTTHKMKGHPGYQGDHIDYCMEIMKGVGSPNFKLLFDFYHVQIMDGDLIRRLDQCKDYLGHIHTAGNPGRGELDENQEINYPPLMRKLLELGYTGYVGQEFIPTRDTLAGLQQACALCDV